MKYTDLSAFDRVMLGHIVHTSNPSVYAELDGDRIRFKGGLGNQDHSISADSTLERFNEHWNGFLDNTHTDPEPYYSKLKSLKSVISDARNEALNEMTAHYPCTRSRGTYLTASVDNETVISMSDEWVLRNLTKKELIENIKDALKRYPNINNISIEGGFDGADSVRDMNEDLYDPWITDWVVTLWDKSWGVPIPFID
ncbi:hypothetical protein QX249_10960 [Vibrio parahaemolyticus]|uniref:Phage protein n=1 Tax=Vibrio parahaemolyticus TaxID=670 RepID=A0AAW8PZ06_VIBPH|nr:hypothetical protein [Vibrio parahaemolyticus]MDS1821182.1 hypothetical protein [Vibrio parahaemolyticus]